MKRRKSLKMWAAAGRTRARCWLRSPAAKAEVTWGLGGLALGMLLMLALLLYLGPQPQTVRQQPPSAPSVTVTVDDSFLSRLARVALAQANLPITFTNVHVHIAAGDALTLSGDATNLPSIVPHHFSAAAQVGATDGNLTVHILRASVGGIALPAPITSALESAVNRQLAQAQVAFMSGNLAYAVTNVTSADNRLTLSLNPRGR